MPTYEVVSPDGRKFRLDGDSPPSEADLDEVFKAGQPQDAATALEKARSDWDFDRPSGKFPKDPNVPEDWDPDVGSRVMRSIGESKPVKKFAKGMDVAGKALVATAADAGEAAFRPITDELYPEQATEGPLKAENLEALKKGEPLPAKDLRVLGKPGEITGAAAQGLLETTPRLAAVAGLEAVGVPAGVTAPLVFGPTEQGFDPNQAAIASALPFVGKYSGAMTEALASKLGISNEAALTIFNKLGGATGAAALLKGVDEAQISQLPPEERDQARINSWAGIAGQAALGMMGGEKKGELKNEVPRDASAPVDEQAGTISKPVVPPTESMAAEGNKGATAAIAPEIKTEAGGDINAGALGEVGMGGAKPGELESGGDSSVTGLAERVRTLREKSGHTEPTEPGEGIAPEASVERGRQLLPVSDPEKIMSEFEKSGRFSSDDVAIVRAKAEELAKATNKTEEKFGTDSNEFRQAFKTESDWAARTKKMQTEWAKSGHAQQGEVDIDTGTFTGLARAFRDETGGKEFTPKQAKQAKGKAGKVKRATDSAEAARTQLYDHLDREVGGTAAEKKALDAANKTVREAAVRVADAETKSRVAKTVNDLNTARVQEEAVRKALEAAQKKARDAAVAAAKAESKARVARADTPTYVWSKAREYIDQGIDDFDEIRNKIATDLGVSVNKVTEALAKSKRAKFLADELWRKQQLARDLKGQAKRWLTAQSTPGYLRFLEGVPKTLFSLKVGFHGTVALGTHAPMVAFQPRFWKTYVTDFAKMYRMVGSKTYYERQVQDLVRRPNYVRAQRAGLVNDPFVHEDFNSPETSKYFGAMTGMGNRGYSVLKILRQDMFDQMWNKLPKTAQIDEVAKALADGLNHSTGVVKGSAPTGANLALFAPRLEASRVAWLAVDPAKAAKTFLNWKNADAGDRVFAINQLKEKAWVAGTMLGMLAINQGILSAIGSNQKVNLTDPLKSDFLKFKIAGMSFSYGNAMISMARLPVRLYQIREGGNGRLKGLVHPDENSYTVLGEYARSQLSPFASLASSLWFKSDWQNRPLPNSNQPVPSRLKDLGFKPYTWKEFLTEQVLPIPAEEAAREVWHDGMGMDEAHVKSMGKAMATIAVMGATGGRLVDDVQPHTIHGLLAEYQKASGGTPDYTALRAALDKDDMKGARAAYDDLLKTKKKPSHIDEVMKPYTASEKDYWIKHFKPLTGSQKTERAFLATLDDDGKIAYEKARVERMAQYQKFKEMLKQKP